MTQLYQASSFRLIIITDIANRLPWWHDTPIKKVKKRIKDRKFECPWLANKWRTNNATCLGSLACPWLPTNWETNQVTCWESLSVLGYQTNGGPIMSRVWEVWRVYGYQPDDNSMVSCWPSSSDPDTQWRPLCGQGEAPPTPVGRRGGDLTPEHTCCQAGTTLTGG